MDKTSIRDATRVPVAVLEQRIDNLRDACALMNDTVEHHRDAQAFQAITDFALKECEIEPIALAKAFEVNTATVSRWRTGKNAPHPRDRPLVVEWLKQQAQAALARLEGELEELEEANGCQSDIALHRRVNAS